MLTFQHLCVILQDVDISTSCSITLLIITGEQYVYFKKSLLPCFSSGVSFGTNAREKMLLASYKAGVAFSKSYVGYIHAIAHSLGGKYGTPHGLANAVIMPYVLESYKNSAHKKLHKLGIAAKVSVEFDSDREGAQKYTSAIRELNSKLNIPDKLPDIKEADIPGLALHAEKEANPLYPVPKLMDARELEAFYYMIGEKL